MDIRKATSKLTTRATMKLLNTIQSGSDSRKAISNGLCISSFMADSMLQWYRQPAIVVSAICSVAHRIDSSGRFRCTGKSTYWFSTHKPPLKKIAHVHGVGVEGRE